MKSPLKPLYDAFGVVAAFFLVMIGIVILTSIVSRQLAISVPGLNAYAGYCMAASSFLALAHTFIHGGHIRVTLVLQRFQGRTRKWAEIFCLAVAAYLSVYFAWYAIKMVRVSYEIGDISQSPDATPLWIPQVAMALGGGMLAVAIVERLILVLLGAEPDEAKAVAEGGGLGGSGGEG